MPNADFDLLRGIGPVNATMLWADVTEKKLKSKKEIPAVFGEPCRESICAMCESTRLDGDASLSCLSACA